MNNIITALNKAFLKLKPSRSEINEFKTNFKRLFTLVNDNESEEYNKNLISDFLKNTYYKQAYFMNTKERKDLVIRNGALPDNTAGVIIETKKFSNKSEMVTCENLNAKALQELVWYFLGERITQKNIDIKHLIITNVYEWFIFDAQIFEKLFAQNKTLVKHYTDFINGTALGNKTEHFYKEIAQPFIEKVKEELHYTYFNLKDFQSIVENDNSQDDNELIPLYKILSPQHLLKLPFVNDSNTLDKGFYAELLHIIGLAETKNGGQILIERPKEGERNEGTMLEETISKLHSLNKIKQLKNAAAYGETYEERLFNVALELNITWINRVLFLKLLEAQLIAYHKDNEQDYAFLNFNKITEYDILERLFFEVLAKDYNDRSKEIAAAYPKIPYLNSSLFEPTELEHSTLLISNLPDDKTIPLLPTTVLKDTQGKKRTGSVKSLQYLLDFLDAYDFSSEGSVEIQEENKTLINAAVLGLIFEKINGYKDGSFFTPGIITMYMCEESLRKATVQKFNEIKGWHLNNFDELKDRIDPFNKEAREEANAIINQIRICDPSVGSGHYLVSALNEFIAMKSDLKILQDEHKNRIHHQIKIENDELLVYEADDNERFFRYNPKNTESQIVQKTLFNEKKTIIENCLFGVDINPNSVKICRLRLWIELLKNAYYKNATELETLPNIDINIKNGNSLLSRFSLDTDLKTALKKTKISIAEYKNAFHKYQNAENKDQKWKLENFIDEIKKNFRTEINKNSKEVKELQKLEREYFLKYGSEQLFQDTLTPEQENHKKQLESAIEKIKTEIEAINSNKIYENAFEWRFEFPQVLDDEGNYIGFDIVVGNPPYGTNIDNFILNFKRIYPQTTKGFNEIYKLFFNRGIDILKEKGILTYITPNTYLLQPRYKDLRKFLLQYSLDIIINLGENVFDNAVVSTAIILLEKKKENSKIKIADLSANSKFLGSLDRIVFLEIVQTTFNDTENNIFVMNIRRKAENEYSLGEIMELKDAGINYQRVNVGLSDKGKSDLSKRLLYEGEKETESDKEFWKGEDINAYYIIENTNRFVRNDIKLNENERVILNRKYFKIIPKLIWRQTAQYPICTIDYIGIWFGRSIQAGIIKDSFINRVSYEYLCGLLNSKYLRYLYENNVRETGKVFPQVKLEKLRPLPIIISKNQSSIVNLVNEAIKIKKEDSKADITNIENQIDILVYKLYGLSYEEMEVITPNIKEIISKEDYETE
ncbi:DUF7149 domain-containing protein [Capnocytophaga leadbetteri]